MSRQVPDSTIAPDRRICSDAALISRVLPTPLSPVTKTAAVSPCSTSRNASSRTSSCPALPTIGTAAPSLVIAEA